MKPLVYLLACAGAFLFAACSSQPQNKKEETPTLMAETVPTSNRLQRMQPSEVKETISYNGKEYFSSVVRLPDETLPIVSNEEGERFVDNRIFLRLSCGGKMLLDKVFTKDSFVSLVGSSLFKHALLEGIVFDKTTSEGFIYAASVGYPDSDLYQPIRLIVSPTGKLSMIQEDVMDENLLKQETENADNR